MSAVSEAKLRISGSLVQAKPSVSLRLTSPSSAHAAVLHLANQLFLRPVRRN